MPIGKTDKTAPLPPLLIRHGLLAPSMLAQRGISSGLLPHNQPYILKQG